MSLVTFSYYFKHISTIFNQESYLMKKITASVLSLAIGLAGCATSSKDIASTYVSPLQYQSYDCAQLASETQRIQTRVVETGGRLDQAATNDKVIMGVGLVLFWPVLFAIGGTKNQEAEFGRLKGEYDAVQKASIDKKCTPPSVVEKPATSSAAAPTIEQTSATATVTPPLPAASSPR